MTGDLTFLICSSSPGNHSFEKRDLRDVVIKQLYICLIPSLWTTGLGPPCPWWSHGFSKGIVTVSVHTVKYLVQCNSQNFKFKRNISPYTQFKPCIGRQLQMVDRGTAHGKLLIFSPNLCMNSSSILRTNISTLQDWVCAGGRSSGLTDAPVSWHCTPRAWEISQWTVFFGWLEVGGGVQGALINGYLESTIPLKRASASLFCLITCSFLLNPWQLGSIPPASFGWDLSTSSGGHLGNAWDDPISVSIMFGPLELFRDLLPESLLLGSLADLHVCIFSARPFKDLTGHFLRNDNQSTAIFPTPTPPSVSLRKESAPF